MYMKELSISLTEKDACYSKVPYAVSILNTEIREMNIIEVTVTIQL